MEADRHAPRRASTCVAKMRRHARSSASTCGCPACCSRRSATARCSAAAPAAVDVDAAMKLPGVERVVRLGRYAGSTAALAVVGRTCWHARQRRRRARGRVAAPPAGALDSAAILAGARAARPRGRRERRRLRLPLARRRAGAPASAAARRIEQVYRAPYLAHAAMEPINCTARVADGKVEVWAPTQVPGLARAHRRAGGRRAADDAVTVHVTYLGGGFGRRLDVDFVGQAVRIALEMRRPAGAARVVARGRPRRTTSTARPASAVMRAEPRRATAGRPRCAITSAGDAITPRWIERGLPALAGPVDTPDKTTSEGLFDQLYDDAEPAHRARRDAAAACRSATGARSATRTTPSSASRFIDELAHAAQQDPVAYRLALLKDSPRHARGAAARRRSRPAGRPRPAQPCAGPGARRRAARELRQHRRRRWSRCRSSPASRGCTASSAPPTSASSSTRASSRSRWRAR